ncbi:MAG: hypothetical protein WC838_02345 [Candidatus Margulisiibacteriota bacterium]|jgi:hypothetical protein
MSEREENISLLTERLEIRMDEVMVSLLKDKAKESGQSIGALVRSAVHEAYIREYPVPSPNLTPDIRLQRKVIASRDQVVANTDPEYRKPMPADKELEQIEKDIDKLIEVNNLNFAEMKTKILAYLKGKIDFGVYGLKRKMFGEMSRPELCIRIWDRADERAKADSHVPEWTMADQPTQQLITKKWEIFDDRILLINDLRTVRSMAKEIRDKLLSMDLRVEEEFARRTLSKKEHLAPALDLLNLLIEVKDEDITNIRRICKAHKDDAEPAADKEKCLQSLIFFVGPSLRKLILPENYSLVEKQIKALGDFMVEMRGRAEQRGDIYFWRVSARDGQNKPQKEVRLSYKYFQGEEVKEGATVPELVGRIFSWDFMVNGEAKDEYKEHQKILQRISAQIASALSLSYQNENRNKIVRESLTYMIDHDQIDADGIKILFKQAFADKEVFMLETWYWERMLAAIGKKRESITAAEAEEIIEQYSSDRVLLLTMLDNDLGLDIGKVKYSFENNGRTLVRQVYFLKEYDQENAYHASRVNEDIGFLRAIDSLVVRLREKY